MTERTAAEASSHGGSDNRSSPGCSSAQLRAAWYDDNVQDVSVEARDLLERYSGIPHEEVLSHALKLV